MLPESIRSEYEWHKRWTMIDAVMNSPDTPQDQRMNFFCCHKCCQLITSSELQNICIQWLAGTGVKISLCPWTVRQTKVSASISFPRRE
jgi:hypothetical protein